MDDMRTVCDVSGIVNASLVDAVADLVCFSCYFSSATQHTFDRKLYERILGSFKFKQLDCTCIVCVLSDWDDSNISTRT